MKHKFLLVILVSLVFNFSISSDGWAVPEGVKTGHSFSLRPFAETFPFRFSIKIDEKKVKVGKLPKAELKFHNISQKKEDVDFSRIIIFLSSEGREIWKFSFSKDISTWRISIVPQGFVGLDFPLSDFIKRLPAGNYTIQAYYQMNEKEGINSISEETFTVVEEDER
ncbi:MAG TPA: hypothetical protein P5150_09195 [Candidatus Ratteibacteria bacterium]|nr:hypothetical protein [Candidatus Ratteibacteria bacterium]